MCRFLSRPRGAGWSEAQEAMSSAAQVFEEVLDTFTTGKAGVLVRPAEDQDAVQAKAELERALAHLQSSEARWDVVLDDSEHPHPWVIVRDSGLSAVANSTRVIGETLVAMGIGPACWQRSIRSGGRNRTSTGSTSLVSGRSLRSRPRRAVNPRPATILWSCGWSRRRGRTSPPRAPSRSGTPSGDCPSNRSRRRMRAPCASACAAPRGSAQHPGQEAG